MVFLSLKSNGLSLFEVCRSFSVWSLPIFYCLKSINLFLFEVCGSFSVWSLPIFYSVKSTIFLLFEVYLSFSVWYESFTAESLLVFHSVAMLWLLGQTRQPPFRLFTWNIICDILIRWSCLGDWQARPLYHSNLYILVFKDSGLWTLEDGRQWVLINAEITTLLC